MAIQLQLQRRIFGLNLPNLDNNNSAAGQFHIQQPGDDGQSSMNITQSQYPLMEMSTDQIDRFIRFQSERFRLLLQHKRNHQIGVFLNQVETRTRLLFQQKDEEIAYAKKRRFDLEQLLKRLQLENQERQRSVQENQATVASLSHALDQIRERISACANDAESSNNNNNKNNEDNRSGEDDAIDCGKKRKRKRKMNNSNRTMTCRICNSRISCMLLLPCRHLCSCKPCENTLDSCPICNTTKKASIEAVIF